MSGDSRLYPQGSGSIKGKYTSSGNLVFVQGPNAPSTQAMHYGENAGTKNPDCKWFGATSGAYMLWDESADQLLLGGTHNNRCAIGAAVADDAIEVGALSGNFLGLQMNFQNAGTTLSRLTGLQVDVDDTSTHTNTIACARFYSEKVSGTGGHEHWGIMSQSTVTAGKVANTCAGMFINIIKGTSAVGTDGGGHRASAIVGEFDMASGADIATGDTHTGACIMYHIGNNANSAAKLKSTGIYIAVLGGDSATVKTGAFFKCVRTNSIAASVADYGLDMYYSGAGAYIDNQFAVADIRLAHGEIIRTYSATPNSVISAAKGSLCIDYTNGALYINNNGTTGWSSL